MIARIFDLSGILFLLGFTAAGFLAGCIFGAVKRESGSAPLLRGVEAGVLGLLGGSFARAFISILIGIDNDSPEACLLVGWGFFLIPGIVDTIPYAMGTQILTSPDTLLLLATIVGGFSGLMSGMYQIYNWRGLGWLAFPLDVTWALAGNTIGGLLHLVNIYWGDHGSETRENAHRYNSGFRLKSTYAFTQGAVMSNLPDPPGSDLFRHERTHVWQSRGFGPMYTLTYLGWMAIWLIPGMIAGGIVKAGVGHGIEKWCYYNNPWEAWAYAVQKLDRALFGDNSEQKRLIWPPIFVILWAVPFFGLATFLAVYMVAKVW